MNGIPEPTNDHERRIVELIDRKLLASDNPYESVVTDVVMSVPFDMSIADTQFLFNYSHWRLAHFAKKQSASGIASEGLKRSG